MSSKMIKELRQFFKEATNENVLLWGEALSAVMRYDSPDCGETLAAEGIEQIENQTSEFKNTLGSVELASPTIVVGTVKQSVDELVLTKQEAVLEALQTAASTANEKMKILNLTEINKNDSLFDSIRNNVQPDAIPMLFAVFSRKNDGYGLG
jgi:hypothetical protein